MSCKHIVGRQGPRLFAMSLRDNTPSRRLVSSVRFSHSGGRLRIRNSIHVRGVRICRCSRSSAADRVRIAPVCIYARTTGVPSGHARFTASTPAKGVRPCMADRDRIRCETVRKRESAVRACLPCPEIATVPAAAAVANAEPIVSYVIRGRLRRSGGYGR